MHIERGKKKSYLIIYDVTATDAKEPKGSKS